MRIVVASKNPVKINATLNGFKRMFPSQTFEVKGISVDSGVSAQPRGDAEVFRGALNRCRNLVKAESVADFFVGILTGDVIDRTHYYTEAVILALIPFKNEKLYFNP